MQSFIILIKVKPNIILTNGPGTAVPLIAVAWLLRLFNILDCKSIFVESYCRIKHLSMSGKIIRYIVNEFIVPWPDVRKSGMKYIDIYPK